MTGPAGPFDPDRASRRAILIAFAATGLALGGAILKFAWPASAANFLELSAILTGRPDLDRDQGKALFDALARADPSFPTRVGILVRRLRDGGPGQAEARVAALKASHPELAEVARITLTAWYLGLAVTQRGERIALARQEALMAGLSAGILPAPGACATGDWAAPPGSA